MTTEEKMIWAAAFALARQEWAHFSPASRDQTREAYAATEAARAVRDFRQAKNVHLDDEAERLRWIMAS
jgi:hypothetical protein